MVIQNIEHKGGLAGFLKSHGVYPTPQRLAIAEVMFECHQHLTADQLYDKVKVSTVVSVSRATVYNTMTLFSENGLVREIHADPTRVFYDSNTSRHHHFFNIDSGELIDFDADHYPAPPSTQLPDGTQLHSVDVVVRVRNNISTP